MRTLLRSLFNHPNTGIRLVAKCLPLIAAMAVASWGYDAVMAAVTDPSDLPTLDANAWSNA